MQHILVVEDEQSIAEMLQLNLELEGFRVTAVNNGREAMELAPTVNSFQLIILDIMLPEISGMDLCRAYRKVSDVPILFLSAKGTTVDRIAGLKLGANDFLPKPFDLEELILRVQNLVNFQSERKSADELQIGEWSVHFNSFEVVNRTTGEQAALSKREIELLQFFSKHEGEVVSRDLLLNSLWSQDQSPTGRTIDNYILNFRKLFEPEPKNPIYFHSIRGVGYKFTLA